MKNANADWTELDAVEKQIRQEIGGFALTKDVRLSEATRWLERTDNLQSRLAALGKDLSDILSDGRLLLNPAASVQSTSPRTVGNEGPSLQQTAITRGGKARGRQCRQAYVAQQAKQGKPLTRVRGALYRNGAGLIIGIAYAKGRNDEWFFGLPGGEFQEAVLLCETAGGNVQPIYLRSSFIEKYSKNLSVSQQYNQAKLTIQRRTSKYVLVIKGFGQIDLPEQSVGVPLLCPPSEYV